MVFFSQLVGREILDCNGKRVGKLKDFIVDYSKKEPTVIALVYSDSMSSRKKLPWKYVETVEKTGMFLNANREDLILPELDEKDVLIGEMTLDKQVVDTDGLKVVRVNDIVLEKRGDDFCVTNIDVGFKGILRRLGLSKINKFVLGKMPPKLVQWENLESLNPDVKNLQLKVSHEKLDQLHPADIADLMEDLTHKERAIIFKTLDNEKAAHTLEEAEPEVQKSVFRELRSERIAEILHHMAPDDAVDLLQMFPKEKINEILELMHPEKATEIRKVALYDQNVAGGLMTTELVSIPEDYTIEQALAFFREHKFKEHIHYLYIVDKQNHLVGLVSLRDLIMHKLDAKLSDVMRKRIISVEETASKEDVGKLFTKYNLMSLPVVNQENVLVGVITADDVIELISPKQWKRSFYYKKKKKQQSLENKNEK
jgi:magnesium transporter